ncbi:PDZ domain-containing protein [Bacillaceae bacterium Marseille-Q3522]|nr:PDZ domain-containing protein [Bacillaceae bacterium Marseille-Q3522]
MIQEWLLEIVKGFGKGLLNPVSYYILFLAAVLGVSRVKRERKQFHARVENAYFELRQLFPLGLLLGLILSVILILSGLVVPLEFVIFTALFSLLWSLTTKIRFLSPAYTAGLAGLAVFFFYRQEWRFPSFLHSGQDFGAESVKAIATLLALFIIAEGMIIWKNGRKGPSPKWQKSKRGQTIGLQEVKRLWLLPVFLLIPGDAIQSVFPWWPAVSFGPQNYSLLFVPISIGFHQEVKSTLTEIAMKKHGKAIIILGISLLVLSIASFWNYFASVIVIGLALISREFITLHYRRKDNNRLFYFTKRNEGLTILGIILESPASKMGLKAGEIITKVNGKTVLSETAFYEALQQNRAHCKLEVLDYNGEIRFVQRALFEGDHYELGILFLPDEENWKGKAG